MLTTFLLLVLTAFAQPENSKQPTLLIRVLQSEQMEDIQVQVKRGQNTLSLHCGDGQEIPWDGVEDGILTCAYFTKLNVVEHILITSKSLSKPIFDNIIHPGTETLPQFSYNITKKGSQWTANRVVLHKTNPSLGAQSTSWEWLIGFWSILIANILGWIWWNSK